MVNRTIILFLLLPWYVLGQESYESNTDRSWRQIEKRLIPPGKTEILLIEQLGADFLIRLDTAGTTTIQDGPDSYHGTEIVLLENLSDRDMEVDLQVAQRFKGVQANVSVESISNPTPSEESLARSLQNFAIAWQAGEYSTEGLESLAPDSSRLSAIGYFTRLQALRLTGQHQKVLSLVKDPPENLTEYKKLRLQWEKAHSLYKTQQITQSLASFSDLAEYLKLDFEDKIEMRLLQKEIRATWGMTLVLSGLSQSSTTVMHEGSEMLDLAMANTRLLADYSMLAEICNFRAAHQSMTGKPDSALKLMRLAESYATEAGNNFLLPMIKNNLAFNLVRKGQIGEAQQLYREAAKMLESTPFKKAHSSLLTRLGTSYQSTGDLRRAFYYHEKSLTSSEDEGLNLFGFQNRLALGSILRSQGNIEEAVRQHLELQQIYSIYLDNWLDERTQLNVELAKDYLDAGDSEKARHYAEKAWSERDKPIRFHYSLDIYTAYAKVLTTLGDLTRAEQVLVSALTKSNNPEDNSSY